MPLTQDDVKRLADLARLQLSDDEHARAEKDLDSILKYVDRLQQVETAGVLPFTMPARAEGWRPDEAFEADELARELILSNFPARRADLLSVPAVFEEPKA